MKTPVFLLALAGVFLQQTVAAPTADITLRVAPERDLVYSRGSREVIVQIDLDGRRPDRIRRAPMNLAVVLDRSGSMRGAKIEKARQAACVVVEQLADDDYFSLVTFDDRTEVLIPPGRVGGTRNREELKQRIERILPGGQTAIHAAVSTGAQQLRRFIDQERLNRIVLLSDGLANVGPSRTADLANLGRELRQESMSVTTVGLGDDYNEDLMTALAEVSNANYYYVRDAEKLPGIFAEELGSARSLIARGVTIRITVPPGVRIREILGQPDIDCSGRTVEIKLPEYFGGDKRRFLARCIADEPTAQPLEVAMVDLRYESGAGEKATAQQNAQVRFTDEERKASDSIRNEIAQEVATVENRVARERAMKLADEGRVAEATSLLRSQIYSNAAAPLPLQLPNCAAENKKLDDAARQLESNGQLDKTSRKTFQYENWAGRAKR
jgi:Ca-activated chloride channel family protein